MERPEASEREINELPPLDSAGIGEYLEPRLATMRPETLVFLYRNFHRMRNERLANLCARYLFGAPDMAGRIRHSATEPVIRKQARRFGFIDDPDLLAEFRNRVYKKVLGSIRTLNVHETIWEERFNLALSRRVRDVARSLHRERMREDRLRDALSLEPLRHGENEAFADAVEEDLWHAISGLPARQRHVAYLRFLRHYEIGEIAEVLDISERMVQKHLSAAKERLRSDPRLSLRWREFRGQGEVG